MSSEQVERNEHGEAIWELVAPWIASEDPPDSGSSEKDLAELMERVLPKVWTHVGKLEQALADALKDRTGAEAENERLERLRRFIQDEMPTGEYNLWEIEGREICAVEPELLEELQELAAEGEEQGDGNPD